MHPTPGSCLWWAPTYTVKQALQEGCRKMWVTVTTSKKNNRGSLSTFTLLLEGEHPKVDFIFLDPKWPYNAVCFFKHTIFKWFEYTIFWNTKGLSFHFTSEPKLLNHPWNVTSWSLRVVYQILRLKIVSLRLYGYIPLNHCGMGSFHMNKLP